MQRFTHNCHQQSIHPHTITLRWMDGRPPSAIITLVAHVRVVQHHARKNQTNELTNTVVWCGAIDYQQRESGVSLTDAPAFGSLLS